ncbi:MAG TPA: DUF58 domain-containing protein [Longimicrobiaceae bacterium]|nr:DUF58 domain-containing protein [Longimicrobiaceae bacterium]
MIRSMFERRKPPGPSAADPDLLRRVRQLEVRTRGLVESLFSGEYVSIFHGRGLEFSHVRGYEVGDDVRSIDWKVTARRGSPYVRQFVEERDLLVVLMVDVSASGRFGPGERSAGEVAAEIAAAICFAATRNNDRLALLLVSDAVEAFIPPGSGRNHTVRLLTELLSHRPRRRSTDLAAGFERIVKSVPPRATVFVISDFIQDQKAPGFRATLGRAAQMHDVVAIRLASAATADLPDVGWVEITDPESRQRRVVDSGSRRVRDRFRHGVQRLQAEMAEILTQAGVELVEVATTADPLVVLGEFFRRRQRVTR